MPFTEENKKERRRFLRRMYPRYHVEKALKEMEWAEDHRRVPVDAQYVAFVKELEDGKLEVALKDYRPVSQTGSPCCGAQVEWAKKMNDGVGWVRCKKCGRAWAVS